MLSPQFINTKQKQKTKTINNATPQHTTPGRDLFTCQRSRPAGWGGKGVGKEQSDGLLTVEVSS
jgi:hypothetical protein